MERVGFCKYPRLIYMESIYAFMTTRCLRCGRLLTDPKSVMRGYGPVCFGKLFGKTFRNRKEEKKDNLTRAELSVIQREVIHSFPAENRLPLPVEKEVRRLDHVASILP
jgi:predicted  nucleic acid-binding Zn-ribbon protein